MPATPEPQDCSDEPKLTAEEWEAVTTLSAEPGSAD